MVNNRSDSERAVVIRKAWRTWAIVFIPLFLAGMVVHSYFGIQIVLPAMVVVLVATLLYQRLVKKRSWHSIMWGVYATKE